MKYSIITLILFIFTIVGCNSPKESEETLPTVKSSNALPYFTFQLENLFPGDGSLLRAEDGVALEDGRIVVVDQATGLRLIETDGSNRPFGDFQAAGYVHLPPDQVTAPNGIVMEHDGEHILMSDVSDGKIYRVNIETESVEMIYDHSYGVNTIYRDKTGAIWFSQSTKSTNMVELFNDVNLPVPHGAIYRMADLNSVPEKVMDSLYFSNGITMNRNETKLYVCETMMDRVHQFNVDVNAGTAEYDGVAAYVGTPDNILVDDDGRLIIASPLYNQVVGIDLEKHSKHIIFDGTTIESSKITNEWIRRSNLGMERLELLSPDLFQPLPGLITGMFYSQDGKTLYVSNLGNDLIKLDY
jgi:sugar lactone lactonase YvrE